MDEKLREMLNEINERVVGDTMRAAGDAALQAKSDVTALVKMARIAMRKKDKATKELLMRAAKTVYHYDNTSAEIAYCDGVVDIIERATSQINALGAHAKAVVEHREKILREA